MVRKCSVECEVVWMSGELEKAASNRLNPNRHGMGTALDGILLRTQGSEVLSLHPHATENTRDFQTFLV